MENFLNLYSIPSFIGALTISVIGSYVFSRNVAGRINRYFALYCLSVAFWSTCQGFLYGSQDVDTKTAAFFWARIQHVGIIFIPTFFMHFIFVFLNETKQEKRSLILAYLFSVIFLCLLPTGLMAKDMKPVGSLRYILVPGILYPFFAIFFATCVFYGLRKLFRALKVSTGVKSSQIKYFLFAFILGYAGASLNFSLPLGWELYPLNPYGTYAIPIYVFIVAYTIVRYHLLDISIVIKRTMLYAILTTGIIGVYVVVILLSEYIFKTTTGHTSLLARIFASFIIAITFLPLRQRIELFIDRVFFRTKYDYQKTLLTFSQSLSAILDLRTLLDLIIRVTTSTLKINKASVMLLNKSTDYYFVTSFRGLPYTCRNWKFNMESKLISWLTNEKKITVRSNFYKKPLSILHFHIMAEMRLLRSAVAIPLFYKQELIGILNLGEKLSGEPYTNEDLELLDTLGSESAIAISNANLFNTLEKTYLQTIQALAQAIEAKDKSTRGHSERVTKVAIEIAKELNIGRDDIVLLQYASILHDVGKIAVEEDILNKPGKLSDYEYERIKIHPVKGEEIIAPVAFLEKVKPIIRYHHERFDGTGYPDGLRGNSIPLLARILSVADVFDALISERPYRVFRMSDEDALTEIQKCSGTQFDPEIVRALLRLAQSNKLIF